MDTMFTTTSPFLEAAFRRVKAFAAGRSIQTTATTAALRSIQTTAPAAAVAAAVTCPGCGNDEATEIYQCHICAAEVCSECADTSDAPDSVVCKNCVEEDSAKQRAAASPRKGVLEPLRPQPSSVVGLAAGLARLAAKTAAPPAEVLPGPVAPPAARPVAAPAPVSSTTAEITRLESLIPETLSCSERYRMLEHLQSLERGESIGAFISREDRESRCAQLALAQADATPAEKWQIQDRIEQVARGEDPAPLPTRPEVAARISALESQLAGADARTRWDICEEAEGLLAGVPVPSAADRARERKDLETQLAAATENNVRFRLAEKLSNLS